MHMYLFFLFSIKVCLAKTLVMYGMMQIRRFTAVFCRRQFHGRCQLHQSSRRSNRWNIDELNAELEQYLGSFNDFNPLTKESGTASAPNSSQTAVIESARESEPHAPKTLSIQDVRNTAPPSPAPEIRRPCFGARAIRRILVLHERSLSGEEENTIRTVTSALDTCVLNIVNTSLSAQHIASHFLSAPFHGLVVVCSQDFDSHTSNVLQLISRSANVVLVGTCQTTIPNATKIALSPYNGLLAAIMGILSEKLGTT